MSLARVCSIDELEDGKPHAVDLAGDPVCLVRAAGEVFAVEDVCSHAEIALSEGEVDGCFIECWLHGSRFDLRTGKPSGPPATEPVATYTVRIDGTDVYVGDRQESENA